MHVRKKGKTSFCFPMTDEKILQILGVWSQLLTFIFLLCQMLRHDPVFPCGRPSYSTAVIFPPQHPFFFFIVVCPTPPFFPGGPPSFFWGVSGPPPRFSWGFPQKEGWVSRPEYP